MKPKVFVSSTVYDLLDVRAEVEQFLRASGLSPVMSDVATSDFRVDTAADSIETCLRNVRACDYFVIILSQRYGPSLVSAGFDDISATHLEYKEAKKHKKPILCYVRSQLESDFAIWKKNKKNLNGIVFSWVVDDKDKKIFGLLDEHRKLAKNASHTNWYTTFEHSLELREILQHNLKVPISEASFRDSIVSGRIPILFGETKVEKGTGQFVLCCSFENCGGSPAYNVEAKWDKNTCDIESKPLSVLPVGKSITLTTHKRIRPSDPHPTANGSISVKYFTVDGHCICDNYDFVIAFVDSGVIYGMELQSKTYHTGNKPPFEIKTIRG